MVLMEEVLGAINDILVINDAFLVHVNVLEELQVVLGIVEGLRG